MPRGWARAIVCVGARAGVVRCSRAQLAFVVALLLLSASMPRIACAAPDGPGHTAGPRSAASSGAGVGAVDAAAAARLLGIPVEGLTVVRDEKQPRGWIVTGRSGLVGVVASTFEVAGSIGYSGRPIDIHVGLTSDGRIAGAELKSHNEPILTLGISSADIARYVQGFAGYDLSKPRVEAFKDQSGLPPILAGATVTTGVIRDAILRTARAVAIARGFVGQQGADIDRVTYAERSWPALVASGAIVRSTLSLKDAASKLGPLRLPLPEGDVPFLDLWVAVLDPPGIGRNILGAQVYDRVIASLGPGDAAVLVASDGFHTHRGTGYLSSGVFELIEVIQGERTIRLRKEDYLRIDKLGGAGAPEFKEMSVFRLPAATGFKASEPFRVEVSAEHERADGSSAMLRQVTDYRLPAEFILSRPVALEIADEPLWVSAWQRKPLTIAFVSVMIAWVASAFFVQEFFVRRPRLWVWGRYGFLLVTLVLLGWVAKGQLSVVQVVAFLQSLLGGFRWETFLIEPVIFILWAFVALGLLFWGRGVYCGWLCPFGALQELLNEAAKRFGVRQIEVPFAIQERLWALKYTLFMMILGLSFYSMEHALILAEVEPFKTVVSMRFSRAWPFVLFALAVLAAGLFIERFYCRYLCPLGAALAIPAKLKLFDWLHRRPQCGRECRFCETKCTVGAIDTLGRINPNECILCLRCQVIMNDETQCVALKRRAGRRHDGAGGTNAALPGA